MAGAAIARAVAAGRLHEVHPAVYSVVPKELMDVEALHAAAILAGGREATLCGASARWWLGLLAEPPEVIHVAVCGPRKPVEGIRWHRLKLREDERIIHRHMPVTTPARTALDLAAELSPWDLKGLLADLEFHHDVDPGRVAQHLRRGFPGSAKLRRALAEHTPQLAETRDHLEREFARLLAECGFVTPRFNQPIGKSTVDVDYSEFGVIIELDGVQGHRGERRILRDHRRDLHRRADGLLPLRYHFAQITSPADWRLIEAELDRVGIPRVGARTT